MNPSIFSTRAVSPLRLLLIGAVLGVFERTLLLFFFFFFLALVTTTEAAAAAAAGFVSGDKERDRCLRRDDFDVMILSGVAGVKVVTTTLFSFF